MILICSSLWNLDEDVGIEGWNDSDEYAFVYVSPKKVLVKCFPKGDKLLVDAVAEGATEPAHLKIRYVIRLSLYLFCLYNIESFLFLQS